MRLVLDTNVVVAAMRSATGASALLLDTTIFEGRGAILVSTPLFFEYEAICTMPHQLVEAGASHAQAVNLLDAIAKVAIPVAIDYGWRPQLRDPADEMVLETAINGQADLIVTYNLRDFGDVPARFGIDAVPPIEALMRMRT